MQDRLRTAPLFAALDDDAANALSDVDPELSIPINSDLYHSRGVIDRILKSLCKIISLKHTTIIQVTDCPDRPRIEINIRANQN